MAIQSPTAELLLLCRRRFPQALDFLMIGRQWLRMQPAEAANLQKEYGIEVADLADPEGTDEVYAEPLLHRMGLRKIEALDASSYEGADVVHDLNQALPGELQGYCDWILDGGSLEHVFDFPMAIRNCSGLLRAGGLFVTVCPVNNWMGHGFYQFSPELFFRAFSAVHGFSVKFAALQVQKGCLRQFYSLRDPAESGHRLQYNPLGRATLLFVAQKTGEPPTGRWDVQQSDYSARWNSDEPNKQAPTLRKPGSPGIAKKLTYLFLPKALRSTIREWRVRRRKEKVGASGMHPCKSLAEAWSHWQ